jgi:hypothetical protein
MRDAQQLPQRCAGIKFDGALAMTNLKIGLFWGFKCCFLVIHAFLPPNKP